MIIKSTLTPLALTAALAAGLAACITEEVPAPPQPTAEQPALTTQSQQVTCTPGVRFCDYSCYLTGGWSADDCITQCNSTGTAWLLVQNCGWAQNWPYSSSCLDRPEPAGPICQWN